MHKCHCGSKRYIASKGGDGHCSVCRFTCGVQQRVRRQMSKDRIYKQAELVYDEVDRSPDSDPNDIERETP